MKKDLTEVVFILDRSGSMSGLESDTVGGFNGLLEKQKKEAGEALITTVLFDDKYELLHDRTNIKGVIPITEKDYYVRGCTALYDAVGKTLSKIENAQKHTAEDERPDKTVVIITTDGFENASREYSAYAVKSSIDRLQKNGWEFIFLGANIDSVKTAQSMGIKSDNAVDYNADSKGTRTNYDCLAEAISQVRTNGCTDSNWRERIDKDYKKRKKN